jgi:hypothetical protein
VTAVQVPYLELVRWLEPPALDAARLDELPERAITELLVARFRAFLQRDLDWPEALLRAVTPDA